jgi:hypothetical protein
VPTRHPRIQVTEDPELTRALQVAAPYLPAGLSRSRQVRELAVAGARHVARGQSMSESERQQKLEEFIDWFKHPESAPWDWDVLRDVKQLAWRERS